MYFGESITRLDDKGRITVPRRIRETMDVLGHAIWYMTRGFDGCIFMFHRDEWDKIRRQVSRFSSMDAQALDFKRFFFSSVAEGKPDAQGRMAVPPHLRDYAGLDREAVVIGVDDHLEVWSKERWQSFVGAKEQDFKEMAGPVFARADEQEDRQRDTEGLSDAC